MRLTQLRCLVLHRAHEELTEDVSGCCFFIIAIWREKGAGKNHIHEKEKPLKRSKKDDL